MTPEEKACWVVINHLYEIGPRRFKALLEKFPYLLDIYQASINDIKTVPGFNNSIAKKLIEHLHGTNPKQLIQQIEAQGISILTLNDSLYPKLLASIYDPPPVLYWKGNSALWSQLDSTLAIIGTRKPTNYGKQIAHQFAQQLAQAGVIIVSGLAHGIDLEAHKGAMEAPHGNTIAVLGCGVDIVYPRQNYQTFQTIGKQGLLISEFPPGFRPKPWTFPMRNRIVSGLSQGIIVVEAGIKSGTLITVDCALEQGREVFAIPGMITNTQSSGTHTLIQNGAHLLTSVEEIFEVLNWNKQTITPSISNSKTELTDLTKEQIEIYSLLENTPQHIDIISERCQSDPTSVANALMILEIKGIIEQLAGKLFIKKHAIP